MDETPPCQVKIGPDNELVLRPTAVEDREFGAIFGATFPLANSTNERVLFKLRTSPKVFGLCSFKPKSGVLEPNEKRKIKVTFKRPPPGHKRELGNDVVFGGKRTTK
jgi:hypothetical protein